jgi:CheY-like chemotaxis protein
MIACTRIVTTHQRTLPSTDPVAIALTAAIQAGDGPTLRQMLEGDPRLAQVRIAADEAPLSLVHVATAWPGHFPGVAKTIATLAAAGADVNARMPPHPKDPNCMETSAIEAINLGVSGYITKPFRLPRILAAAQKALGEPVGVET